MLNDEPSQSNRQFESSRTGAAGVEVQDTVARLLLRSVSVAGDHDVESGGLGLQIEALEIVQHVNGNAAQLHRFCLGQRQRPRVPVHVAANRRDRCNRGQSLKDFRVSNVASVNDSSRPLQRLERFGPEPAVGIGNDADDDGSSQFLGSRS